MGGASDYSYRLKWYVGSRTTDTDSGEKKLQLSANGYLWCNVEETNGRRGDEAGERTGADATIRLRNYPAITVDDMLLDETFDQWWRIDTLYQGDNEMVLQAFRHDSTLEDFTVVQGDI
jgi:hypothetical protein